ncbi:VOC family protein [Marinobacter sp. DUT-3]|uniref:VOC family protein n=1 Tax=Marinobacter sp. DUT-3 TaxID=3412036 RepID=UPI003D176F89
MNQVFDSERKVQTSAPATQGIHHLGLTVKDINEVAAFFREQLNFSVVGEVPDYPAIFVSDGHIMLTLWQAREPDLAIPFDRHSNIGLHHFALHVANVDTLEVLFHRLSGVHGVGIEFEPQPLGQSCARHMMCLIPGGLRVEFIAA